MSPLWTFESAGPDGGGYVAPLDPAEREVLLDAVDDVVSLLGGSPPTDADAADAAGSTAAADAPAPGRRTDTSDPLDALRMGTAPGPTPRDPALLRLLPDGYREDAEVAGEFRRLTEADVRATKVANLHRLRTVLRIDAPEIVVTREVAPQVAAALTDLRLVVSERLGIRTDEDSDALFELVTGTDVPPPANGAEAVRRFLATLYTMLGMLQESLLGLMLEDLPEGPAGRR